MPASHVDAAGIGRAPKPRDCSGDARVRKLCLVRGRINQRQTRGNLARGARMHTAKASGDRHRVEQVVGPPFPIQLRDEVIEAVKCREFPRGARREPGHHREWNLGIVRRLTGHTVGTDLIDPSIQCQHLAVQPIERAQPEIAVPLQIADRHHAVVNALHQRPCRGDLEHRRVLQRQCVGKRRHDDMRNRLAGATASLSQGPHQRL